MRQRVQRKERCPTNEERLNFAEIRLKSFLLFQSQRNGEKCEARSSLHLNKTRILGISFIVETVGKPEMYTYREFFSCCSTIE